MEKRKGFRKIIYAFITLAFSFFILPMTSTYAYDYNVGDNVANTYSFLSQFTVVVNDTTTSTAVFSKNDSINTTFTIVFLDTATDIGTRFELLIGSDIRTYDFSDTSLLTNYYKIQSYTSPTISPKGMMFYAPNFNQLEDNNISFKTDSASFNFYNYLNSYAKVIYDTPTNILTKTIGYYESQSYDFGVQEGQDEMYADGSAFYGYSENGSYDYLAGYDNGQTDMYNNGSSEYGYVVAESFDYGIGFDEGSALEVNNGLATFTANFDKWIVPAIVLVLLLGGTITVVNLRRRNEE